MRKPGYLLLLLMFFCYHSDAQERWAAEFRPQLNFPIQQPNDIEFSTGYGFEVMLSYDLMQHLGIYAGWGWNNFQVDDNQEMNDPEFEETGYSIGIRFIRPFTPSLSYLLGAGGIYKHFEAEDASGNINADSGHEWGWEAQAGLVVEIGGGFELRPQVLYRALATNIDLGVAKTDLDLQYLSFGLAAVKKFGK